MLERLFKLKENNTTVKKEVMAGVITFMTMAYILAVNPNILSSTGMDATAVLLATAIASFIGTAIMALTSNYPFALSAGMGLNAYFAYTVVLGFGYSWQFALFAVFIEGIIFIILSLTNIREAIFNAIPLNLKYGVTTGIGLFIAFIGLQNAGLSVDSATLVTLTSFKTNFATSGITALLALVGLIIIAALYIRKVNGALFFGIIITWIIGIICQFVGLYVPDPAAGFYSLLPSFTMTDFSTLGTTFGQCFNIDFASINIMDLIVIVFAFLFVDIFDTLGTVIGVASKADMLDEKGRLERIRPVLLSDAIATTAGAVLGTSTITTFVESASGVSAGGRTGLTAMTTAVLFLLATLLAPIFVAIPSFATAPALIFVGFLMMSNIGRLRFDTEDLAESLPPYLAIIAMPLFYSISEGIIFGIVSYVLLNIIAKKGKKISPLMYVLAVLFILKYIFL